MKMDRNELISGNFRRSRIAKFSGGRMPSTHNKCKFKDWGGGNSFHQKWEHEPFLKYVERLAFLVILEQLSFKIFAGLKCKM